MLHTPSRAKGVRWGVYVYGLDVRFRHGTQDLVRARLDAVVFRAEGSSSVVAVAALAVGGEHEHVVGHMGIRYLMADLLPRTPRAPPRATSSPVVSFSM